MEIVEKKITFEDIDLVSLFGYNDTLLKIIEKRFQTALIVRGNTIILKGDYEEIKTIELIFNELIYLLKRNGILEEKDVETVIELVDNNKLKNNHSKFEVDSVIFHGIKESLRARSPKQMEYYKKVLDNDLVFAIGPAGTGKTFLAVAIALSFLRRNEVSKIVLSRPAVEAGESLGFLPGDLNEKLDPYLRPLTDALFYMLSPDKMKSMMEKQIIEITPLAYMRGRTLNNSFIILDEAQNATITQMKMFLTRLGQTSRAIITGDVTQVDLQDKKNSGLIHVQSLLKKIDGIDFVYFSNHDVVRHRLVAEIIKAYENEYETKSVRTRKIKE
jgi:phosphate starvation-inducible protein PhoH and related proteins